MKKIIYVSIFLLFAFLCIIPLFKKQSFVMINMGDSLTNGTQSGLKNVHEHTQKNGFVYLLAKQLRTKVSLDWNIPYLIKKDDGSKIRINSNEIPYNLGVDSSTIKQLMEQKTNSGNDLLDLLMSPIPKKINKEVSQLEAALYVAGLHPSKKIIFTLWTGNNDVLWSVINNYGTEITPKKINEYLNDTEAEHDLASVKRNLTYVVNKLKAVPNSHVFIGTLPYMTRPAFFFSKEDIERLSQYPNPNITALTNGESLGFGPFLTLAGSGIFGYTSSNKLANTYIAQLPETYKLSKDEIAIADKRIDEINNYIKSLEEKGKVSIVNTFEVFQSVYSNRVEIDGHKIYKTFGCGGFSFDAFHPSNTTHAMLANKFIKKINESLNLSIPMVDVKAIFVNDPYQDRDGDYFAPGPGAKIIGSETLTLFDCDDTNKNIIAPFISGKPCK